MNEHIRGRHRGTSIKRINKKSNSFIKTFIPNRYLHLKSISLFQINTFILNRYFHFKLIPSNRYLQIDTLKSIPSNRYSTKIIHLNLNPITMFEKMQSIISTYIQLIESVYRFILDVTFDQNKTVNHQSSKFLYHELHLHIFLSTTLRF